MSKQYLVIILVAVAAFGAIAVSDYFASQVKIECIHAGGTWNSIGGECHMPPNAVPQR